MRADVYPKIPQTVRLAQSVIVCGAFSLPSPTCLLGFSSTSSFFPKDSGSSSRIGLVKGGFLGEGLLGVRKRACAVDADEGLFARTVLCHSERSDAWGAVFLVIPSIATLGERREESPAPEGRDFSQSLEMTRWVERCDRLVRIQNREDLI